jgi:hypothetical protein
VETSLVLTAFMTLLLGMVGVGHMLFVKQTLTKRAQDAARWGAIHGFETGPIRNFVLYGTATPEEGAAAINGLSEHAVQVTNPGCPGDGCRIKVEIPSEGIRAIEAAEEF